ncbi:S1 RNA-binding domain-containing protein [Dermatobacter hominis]|uniref:S1 RNA-binding domain-containing protein n=1 Tax=Dermatobacter hominis TaxID=2884263 RepID=UPI001D1074C7|nr:S1 RNA-binding domain-containing protein [Dermatobacter hominis]UDY38038.1 S1 RNA-binding domain-containing protein [Dermatobacter hominis]
MSQRIREVERELKYEEYAGREGDIVTGIIQQSDARYTLLDLGRVEALLPQSEQVNYERPEPGERVKAYIVEVRRTVKGPQIVVSRTHPGLIRRLFELEVPEIADGIVEIKACAREPGSGPRSPSGRTTRTSTRSAPAWAPGAPASAWSSTSCGARRSTSSRSATTATTS